MHYPKFIENKQFYSLDNSKSELDQFMGMSENLKKIHLLSSTHFNNFEELIAEYLSAGIEIFQMETGIVSHIIDGKDYIVKDVISPLDVIQPGNVFELENTYCNEVYKSKRVVGFPEVGAIEQMKVHPVYLNLKLEAYISAPIFVENILYGTLNFTSRTPRTYGFSEHEHDLISLMANAIGNFILLQNKENSLIKLNNRLKEFVGFVAHDLRNPLGVVSNLAQITTTLEMSDDEKNKLIRKIKNNADRSLELVNSILEIAALGTGKITLLPKKFNISECLNKALDNYELFAKDCGVRIALNVPENLHIFGDEPRLKQVFHNLISNAIKHAENTKPLEIYLHENTSDTLGFTFKNGTSESNASKIINQKEHGSTGFGLEIVKHILALHHSTIDLHNKGNKFTASFVIPKNINLDL